MEKQRQDGPEEVSLVRFTGSVNERLVMENILHQGLKPQVIIDLKNVSRINSTGTQDFIKGIREISHGRKIMLSGCSMAMVQQFNMIDNMTQGCRILSFYAPYYCNSCDAVFQMEIDVEKEEQALNNFQAPSQKCRKCGEPLEFDDIETKYFHFLQKK
ncbi:hypothetical protein ACFL5V_08845 [Fibrobacterota bacterium]